MNMSKTLVSGIRRASASIALLSLLTMPLAAAEPARSILRRAPRSMATTAAAPETQALTTVLVTDIDPARVAAEGRLSLHPDWNGPFRAHQTLAVWVVAVMDRRALGTDPLDVITRFVLPDGSVYQTVTTPVNPEATPGMTTERKDISPLPVEVVRPQPFSLLTSRRGTFGLDLDARALRAATFTSVMLPVSGTWITRHNLYGDWTVEVRLVRDGKEIGRGSRVFYIGL